MLSIGGFKYPSATAKMPVRGCEVGETTFLWVPPPAPFIGGTSNLDLCLSDVRMADKDLVRNGYEAIASAYVDGRSRSSEDVSLLDDLISRLAEGSIILDAGCGAGVPVAQVLSRSFRLIGIDFAGAQIRLARVHGPAADLVLGDIAHLPFQSGSFDAVVSYYAIIHVPREEHRDLVRDIHRLLKPSGLTLLCMGEHDSPRDVAEYMGTRMFWSHYDGETNARILIETGFEILWAKPVIDFQNPAASHRFFLARKR